MGRFALALVAVGLAVGVGVGLVVYRGVATIDEHQALNHRLLVERVVDEFERELGALVAREDRRPFTDYRYFVIPPGMAAGSVAIACSPVVAEQRPGYVLGYYQREPDGSLRSPAVPANDALAEEVFGYRADEPSRAFLERARSWFDDAQPQPSLAIQLPLQEAQELKPVQTEPASSMKLSKGSLNRGYEGRDRQSKLITVDNSSVYNYQADAEANLVQQQVMAQVQGKDELAAQRLREIEGALRPALPGADAIDVEVAPLAGRMVEGALLLERPVAISEQVYRQGLALDPEALLRDIADRVLAGSDLQPYLALHWLVPGAAEPPPPQSSYSFAYRFAEPFAAIGMRVDLDRVPGERPPGTAWLLALGLGMLALVALGLVAVHRVVGARLAYARRRSDFVAAVTHELKTPLTSIRMYGEMLGSDMGATDEARGRYAGIITAEGERLSRLIDNVLELGRLERDDRELAITVGDPAELLRGAVAVCGPHAERHGFALELDCPDGLPACRCDTDALVQVVVNLVDNAVKFAAEAEDKRIVLSARTEDGRLVLAVRDFGPGVPEAQLARVCEAFYRGERELTRKTSGTGIGLALVRGLVARMAGELRLANHPQGGFVAEVRLATA